MISRGRLTRAWIVLAAPLVLAGAPRVRGGPPTLTVTIDARRPVATFVPDEAFGVAFDGGEAGESRPLLDPDNRKALTGVGVARGSYRLRTELGIEAWHWSAFGRWSDPGHARGYWTGDPDRDDPSPVSHGYRLPRRGDTLDEAGNDGFSRLDDGDPATFWKSNPYFDAAYTHAAGERAEWIKIELAAPTPVDTVEIAWAHPFARRFRVQRWDGETPYDGRWVDFPGGRVEDGTGGVARLRLSPSPVVVRWVRIALLASSHTAAAGETDRRDALGYAVGEIRLGRTAADGSLVDAIRHAPDHKGQTVVYVSSTDPWHRAQDLDPGTEQPSPLALVKAGLIGRGPMMLPVGVLYDTPENAAAELAYFERRGLKLGQVELGEEPDGQRVTPADYAMLYAEFARALHERWPRLVLGGPSLINGAADTWLEEGADHSWASRLMTGLKAAGAVEQLGFFSFEHYPFDDLCGPASAKLQAEPAILDVLFRRLRADGVPSATPLVISEYGLSAYSGQLEVETPSALFTADAVAGFLSRGGGAAYLYGFAPNRPAPGHPRCPTRGNMMLWEADEADRARWVMPSYYGYALLTREWAQPGGGRHDIFAAKQTEAGVSIGVYPVHRPDGCWAVMLVNRSDRPATLALRFEGGGPSGGGPVEVMRYGPDRYRWSVAAERPTLDLPPVRSTAAGWSRPVTLPPMSLTVMRDALPKR